MFLWLVTFVHGSGGRISLDVWVGKCAIIRNWEICGQKESDTIYEMGVQYEGRLLLKR